MKRILKLSTPVILITIIGLIGMQFMQSCRRNIEYINGDVLPFDNSTTVNANFIGIVTDEAGVPIDNATVTIGVNTALTNSNGLFFFKNIKSSERATTILAKKPNFFNGSKTIMVKDGQTHSVKITMMDKGIAKTFVGSNGGTVQFNNVSMVFESNSIVNASTGDAYAGQVLVHARYIDPTTTAGLSTMPGDLRGISYQSGEEKVLQSFAMMAAELTDVNGNLLKIKTGAQALISFDVPNSLKSSAPASIPLWSYNEASGMWVEEGIAYLKNGKYEGSVKHFSFWNCDTPAAAVNLQVTFVDQNNIPLQGYQVVLTNQANNDTRYGTTNNSGWVGGLVYSNATLTMQVKTPANACNTSTVVHTQNVITSAININLGTIMVTLPTVNVASVDGTVLDCNNLPLANSIVHLSPSNIMITTNASGYFTYSLTCIPTGPQTFTAYDVSNYVNGSTTTTLVGGMNNLGYIYACGNVTPFLNFTLTNTVTSNTQNINLTPPSGTISSQVGLDTIASVVYPLSVVTGSNTLNQYLSFKCNDTTAVTSSITGITLAPGNTVFTDTQYTLAPGSTVTYTSFPLFPGHALGSFSANLVGVPSGQTYTATGTFRAPRTN